MTQEEKEGEMGPELSKILKVQMDQICVGGITSRILKRSFMENGSTVKYKLHNVHKLVGMF